MDDQNQSNKERTNSSKRGGRVPRWPWVVVAAGALSVLVGWLLRRQSVPQEAKPSEAIPYPLMRVVNTPVENLAPVVQEIPLPAQMKVKPS